MEDLRREIALIKNPALAIAKQKKITQSLSTDAMRKEQIKRNQQLSQTKATQNKNTISTPTPKPSTPKPSTPKVTDSKVKGIIPTTSNSVTQPVQTTPTPQQTTEKNIQDMIEELSKQMRTQRIAELQAAYERALTDLETTYGERKNVLGTTKESYITALENALRSNISQLESELAKIQPFYYDKRNEAAASSDIGALNFAQYMASRGVKGAAAGLPEIYRNAALQQRIGALDVAEAQDVAEVERTRSDVQREYEANLANVLKNYASDLQALEDYYLRQKSGLGSAFEQDRLAALAGIDAQRLQATIEQMNRDRQFGLQEGQLMGMYKGKPTLETQQFQFDKEFRDRQFGLQEGQLMGMYKGKPTLEMQQFQFDKEFREKQFEADQRYRNRQLAIESAYRQGQISAQQAQSALAQAKFDHEVEMDYINALFRAKELESAGSLSSKERANIMAQIDQMALDSERKRELARAYGILP